MRPAFDAGSPWRPPTGPATADRAPGGPRADTDRPPGGPRAEASAPTAPTAPAAPTATAGAALRPARPPTQSAPPHGEPTDPGVRWAGLRAALAGERLPCALVWLPAFDRNLERCLAPARAGGKTLRLATKSVRAPALLARALARAGDVCRGLMCFSAREAVWLAARGFDDLLVAYPTLEPAALDALAAAVAGGASIRLVVDDDAHLAALAAAASRHGTTCEAVVELDVALRPLPGLHLGVRRSPLRTAEDVLARCRTAERLGHVRVTGLMAYEAHVAGLPDRSPATPRTNPARRLLRRIAAPRAAARRADVVARVRAAGVPLALVNGGGTGSLARAAREPALSEVTAGSALLAPHLFDGFSDGLGLEPAAAFALEVVRRPAPNVVTCLGGGYAASGAAGPDRLPVPWLPPGLALLPHEGAGEVQTPLRTTRCATPLALGDPVLFRHAKAGELAEHFDEYLLVDHGPDGAPAIVDRVPTYRGLGARFP